LQDRRRQAHPGVQAPGEVVIHAVGPRWNGGRSDERELLASCYRKSLALARDHHLETSAFPAISTGVSGYSLREAADVAIATIATELGQHELPRRVILCTYNALATMITTEAFQAFQERTPR
jgi:O-acetyl-ADP-ribose deacetylase (regulator of RNase III)